MDTIDKIILKAQDAIKNNIEGDGLEDIFWDELTQGEKDKFLQNFEPLGSNFYMIKIGDREFTINVRNIEEGNQ